jgi:hypothetical protein
MGSSPSHVKSDEFDGPPPLDKYLEWADLRLQCGTQPNLPPGFNPTKSLVRNVVDLNVALMQRISKAIETFSYWEGDVSQAIRADRALIQSRT